MLPLVSIIIPFYNSEDFLDETIQSAKKQTWENTEIILIDDGSTDGSLCLAKKYASDTIKILHQDNKGASAARNYGLREAKGDYIQFLDADDLLDPDKITEQLIILSRKTNSIAFGHCIHFFGADGNFQQFEQFHPHIKEEEYSKEFIKKLYGAYPEVNASMIEVHSWLCPKNIIDYAGMWNEELSVDDDGEYFLRVLLSADKVINVPSSISYYRKRKNSNSLAGQILEKNGFQSALKALDLKFKLVEKLFSKQELENIFAKFYWEKALLAYPEFKKEYWYCAKKANELNYKGPKFMGGANAAKLASVLGWKTVKQLQYLKKRVFN